MPVRVQLSNTCELRCGIHAKVRVQEAGLDRVQGRSCNGCMNGVEIVRIFERFSISRQELKSMAAYRWSDASGARPVKASFVSSRAKDTSGSGR